LPKLIKEIWNKINLSKISEKHEKRMVRLLNGIFIAVNLVVFLVLQDKVQSAWNIIEGKVWLGGIILLLIISFIGIDKKPIIRKLKGKFVRFICKIFYSNKIIKEIETLIQNCGGLS